MERFGKKEAVQKIPRIDQKCSAQKNEALFTEQHKNQNFQLSKILKIFEDMGT